jgi:hypothetical protein
VNGRVHGEWAKHCLTRFLTNSRNIAQNDHLSPEVGLAALPTPEMNMDPPPVRNARSLAQRARRERESQNIARKDRLNPEVGLVAWGPLLSLMLAPWHNGHAMNMNVQQGNREHMVSEQDLFRKRSSQ